MTVCNMSIEAGAKAGLIAPDDTTFDYLRGPRPRAEAAPAWDDAVAYWRTLATDDDATFDKEVRLDAAEIRPHVSWGTNPGQVVSIDARVPDPASFADPGRAQRRRAGPRVHGPRTPARPSATSASTPCSSGRARTAASRTCASPPRWPRAARVAGGIRTLVVPGSWAVKAQAEAEGLDAVFRDAGFDWREPGLLDVPGHEPRQARSRRAVRVDVEPELRGPPGPRRPHAPRLPRRRRRHGHRRPLRHSRRISSDGTPSASSRAPRCRSTAPTSTPTRSSPATGSSRSSAPASRRACSRSGATTRRSC